MASIGLLGGLRGASKVALDRMQDREEAERELKKQQDLERLRAETQKELEDYNRLSTPNEAMSSIDYETGRVTLRGQGGNVIGERAVNASEKAAYEAKQRKASLDEEADRLRIASSKQSMELARRQDARAAAQHGKYMRGDKEGDEPTTLADRIRVANIITDNLSKQGFKDNEVLAARSKLLAGARKGWSLDQFTVFEEEFTGAPDMRRSVRRRDLDADAAALLRSTKPRE